ncbi:MAG: FAD:protein FMN transferase [Candidatus Magasanikiibacteriota bacterium]
MYHVFSFKAFDCTISGMVDVGDNFVNSALLNIENSLQEEAKKFDKLCSRFDDESELSRINQAIGYYTISESLSELLVLAKDAYTQTNGIFDPTIAKALRGIGYNKSFSEITSSDDKDLVGEDIIEKIKDTHNTRPKFSELIIDKENSRVYMPDGMQIDLGGIAKGFWVDKMLQTVLVDYPVTWLSAGGDIYVRGADNFNNIGKISIQDPTDLTKDLLTCKIDWPEFGVATSGVAKRRGRRNGKEWHHIINPQTGLSAETDLLSATVFTKTTKDADVYAKTAIILGSQKAEEFLQNISNCEYVLINREQKIIHSPNLTITYV